MSAHGGTVGNVLPRSDHGVKHPELPQKHDGNGTRSDLTSNLGTCNPGSGGAGRGR